MENDRKHIIEEIGYFDIYDHVKYETTPPTLDQYLFFLNKFVNDIDKSKEYINYYARPEDDALIILGQRCEYDHEYQTRIQQIEETRRREIAQLRRLKEKYPDE